jgi:hypothetical protein
MSAPDDSIDEAERRRKVAEQKMWGATIEAIDRMRKQPLAHSIILRLWALYNSINELLNTAKVMGRSTDPAGIAPSFTTEQTNFLITTYNSIIEDIHSNLSKKDPYVTKFSAFEILHEPTINDVVKTLFMMGTNTLQITSYMLRW